MSEQLPLIQYVINQRELKPSGLRIFPDGRVERCSDTNERPDALFDLARDRELAWESQQQLSGEQIEQIKNAVYAANFFDLPARLLINYCKDDPPTAIWTASVDGQTNRVVVYDPRPKRSVELDRLAEQLKTILN